ncbi:MAG: GNAT family N-acetyltransferase [Actinobacteria bacterium]|nr:GNAT family N-acetyltransferase [Actinomycetota bacterium]NBY15148.1 GNAT family N-acetyltransferase [Actinomycetota bacterium]
MGFELRPIDANSLDQLNELICANPVRNSYVASRLEQHGLAGINRRSLEIVGAFAGQRLESAMLFGANLVPIATTQPTQKVFADLLVRQGRKCSSIVGPANEVLQLWSMLEHAWGPARAIRPNQPLMMTQTPSLIAGDDRVHYSSLTDLDVIFPACVSMFTQEVGISPVDNGGGPAYRNRISELISARHSFVRIDNDQVTFKTEVGSVGAGVAQLQGVWVNPELRGQGVGASALSTVVRYVLADIAPTVSLYVNDFNRSAISVYEKVGFKQVDSFATVLF